MLSLDMGKEREKETVSLSRSNGLTHRERCRPLMTVNYTNPELLLPSSLQS